MTRTMRIAFCTVATKPTISLARVTARSFAQFHPGIPFFCLLADQNDGFLVEELEPFKLLYLSALNIPHQERLRFRYDAQQLTFACAPLILRHLLDLDYQVVCFVKLESMFFGPCTNAIDFCASHTVMLTASHISPVPGDLGAIREVTTLLAGAYNGGFVGVSDCGEARAFLAWWAERLSEHCYRDVAEGLHFDQRWLDLVPSYFPGFGVFRRPGFNVGHWCLPDRNVRSSEKEIIVDGEPCSLARFSGYDFDQPNRVTVYFDRLTVSELSDAAVLFHSYYSALQREGFPTTRHWPYAYGTFSNAVPVPSIARHVYASHRDWEGFGDPFDAGPPHSFFRWLNGPDDTAGGSSPYVTRLWRAVYEARPDVRAAFGELSGEAKRDYLRWTAAQGSSEHNISRAFVSGMGL